MKALKYIIASFLLITCFSSNILAQTEEEKKDQEVKQDVKPDNPNAAEITFEKEIHDYGTIKQGADGGCEFKFKKNL